MKIRVEEIDQLRADLCKNLSKSDKLNSCESIEDLYFQVTMEFITLYGLLLEKLNKEK